MAYLDIADLELNDYWEDIDDDDTLSSDSLDYDGTDNWPLHADCKYDMTQAGKEAWVLSPRTLKNLCALTVVKTGLICHVSSTEVPKDLYKTLFIEACRLKWGSTIASLVSTWPDPVLDLRDVEIPLDCYRGYYTKAVGSDKSLAAMVIDGLLQMKPCAKLKKVILPESEAEGAALMKAFLQLPATVLQTTPWDVKLGWLREHTQIEAAANYLKTVNLCEFKPDQFAGGSASPIIISLPGVVQWIGRSSNHLDVLVGLALSRRTPFVFQFERVSLCNSRNMHIVRDILKLIPRPELLRRLSFVTRTNSLFHAYSYLDELTEHLKMFTSLESIISTTTGLYVFNCFPVTSPNFRSVYRNITSLFTSWKNLQEIDLGGNALLGKIGNLLLALEQPMRRLNLQATGLTRTDFNCLAESHHAPALIHLNLDHNDLHKERESVKKLFQNLKSIVTLRTCNCRLNYQDSVSLASALSHSETIKSWNLLQNRLSSLSELKKFVHHCSQIPSLKELGCKPIELALFAGVYIHNEGPAALTDHERHEILELANRLNLMVF